MTYLRCKGCGQYFVTAEGFYYHRCQAPSPLLAEVLEDGEEKQKGGEEGMPRFSEIYPTAGGNLLNCQRAEELELWGKPLTIKSVEVRDIKGKQKAIVEFEEIEERLALNKTNAAILAEAFGDDTAAPIGKKVTLTKTKVQFSGRLVDSIVISPVVEKKKR